DVAGTTHAAALIGQGQVLTSPMGMAVVAASLSAGQTVTPTLIRNLEDFEAGPPHDNGGTPDDDGAAEDDGGAPEEAAEDDGGVPGDDGEDTETEDAQAVQEVPLTNEEA